MQVNGGSLSGRARSPEAPVPEMPAFPRDSDFVGVSADTNHDISMMEIVGTVQRERFSIPRTGLATPKARSR